MLALQILIFHVKYQALILFLHWELHSVLMHRARIMKGFLVQVGFPAIDRQSKAVRLLETDSRTPLQIYLVKINLAMN